MQAIGLDMKETTCSCAECRQMCERSCCLPTPDEARALIRAGHGARLSRYSFPAGRVIGPSPAGMEGADLTDTNHGACTFYRGGLCELHDAGLKPLEGRLAGHGKPWLPIRQHVVSHWRGKRFESVSAMLGRS